MSVHIPVTQCMVASSNWPDAWAAVEWVGLLLEAVASLPVLVLVLVLVLLLVVPALVVSVLIDAEEVVGADVDELVAPVELEPVVAGTGAPTCVELHAESAKMPTASSAAVSP